MTKVTTGAEQVHKAFAGKSGRIQSDNLRPIQHTKSSAVNQALREYWPLVLLAGIGAQAMNRGDE